MKYQLKSYNRENVIMFLLLISFICYVTTILLAFPVKSSDPVITYVQTNVEEEFNFMGSKKSEIIFDGIYANYIYDNEGKTESHFVNLEEKKEVAIDSFIKEGMQTAFYDKIYEVLKAKYPSYIAQILNSSIDKTYVFNSNNLSIYYNNVQEQIDIKDDYYLEINYNDLNQYLRFNVNTEEKAAESKEFIYDKEKISVAFSFDDGPNSSRTITLINELEKRQMSATFFMVGNKLNNDKETVKYVYNSHSEVGYHSWNHSYFTKQTKEKIIDEYAKTDKIFNEITGSHLYLTRPPYGAYNSATLEALQTPLIRWDIDTNDWRYRDSEYIKNYVLEHIYDGAIILFHDTYDTTITAAVQLLEELKNRDVQVMSVSQLAKLKGIDLIGHNVYYSFKK